MTAKTLKQQYLRQRKQFLGKIRTSDRSIEYFKELILNENILKTENQAILKLIEDGLQTLGVVIPEVDSDASQG